MADNYIERRQAAYEAAKQQHKSPRSAAKPADGPLRRVFVTGGAHGIGRAIVQAFCEAHHRVAFCDADEQAGRLAALQTGSRFFHLDVADTAALQQAMQQLFGEWGDVDVVINNAGISQFVPLAQESVEHFDRLLAINLRPVFVTSRELARHRQAQEAANPFGRIVNIASTRYLMSEPGCEGYAASKGGIYSLTHALALSLAPLHITVNSIAPGWIETGDYSLLSAADHAQHPSGRVGRPQDVARLCLFLCRADSDFVNGENIVLDGGMTKKMIYCE